MWSGQPQSCSAVFGGPQPQRRDALWLIFYFSISLSLSLISASLISLPQGLLQNGRRRALNQTADLLVVIRLLGETLEGIWSTTKKRADMFFFLWVDTVLNMDIKIMLLHTFFNLINKEED